jgi:hypothetical protein
MKMRQAQRVGMVLDNIRNFQGWEWLVLAHKGYVHSLALKVKAARLAPYFFVMFGAPVA